MPTFAPPATDTCPTDYVGGNDPYYPASQPLRTLMGRYRGELRAPNVYKLTDAGAAANGGSYYTTEQPYDWPTQGTIIAFTYYGGHTYDITSAEATALTAAGYGAGVTP